MGLASNQARLNVLTVRKSDLEYRLTLISNQTQMLAAQKSEEINKKSEAYEKFLQGQKNGTVDANVKFSDTQAAIDYETAFNELEMAETRLETEQKALETEHQAVDAEKEEISKLVNTNIKNSFGYFN